MNSRFSPKPPGGIPPRPAARSRYQNLLFDARRFFEAKDYDTAFKIYTQALPDAPPGDSTALTQLCRCYRKKALKLLKKEDFTAVLSLLEEMLALPNVEPVLKALDYKVLGEAALELGQLDKAQTAFDQALSLDPDLAQTMATLRRRLKTELLSREMNGLL